MAAALATVLEAPATGEAGDYLFDFALDRPLAAQLGRVAGVLFVVAVALAAAASVRQHRQMPDAHYRTCPLCEAMCGLEVHVDDGTGRADPAPTATTCGARASSARRARRSATSTTTPTGCARPMVRDGETWREVTWDEAFARCEELLHGVLERARHRRGHRYIGNPTAHNFSLGRYVGSVHRPGRRSR